MPQIEVSWYGYFGNFIIIEVTCKPRCNLVTSLALSVPGISTSPIMRAMLVQNLKIMHECIHELHCRVA